MPYHHEYHLAATVDKDNKEVIVIPPVISAVTGNCVQLTRRILTGICALIVAAIVIALCVQPQILLDWLYNNKNDNSLALLVELEESSWVNNSSSLTSDSSEESRKKLLKEISPNNVYEHSYVRSLSQEHVESILQLRSETEEHLTHDYMRKATYLSTWLRAKDWIVEEAKEMLLEHLDWRVEYEIDSIMEANFTYFDTELPYYKDGVDKRGGPVFSISIEDWDLRKVVIGGGRKEFMRYIARIFESAIQTGFKAQANGTNISQGMLILNINKYSFAKHGCFTCLSLLGGFLFGIDDNYPGWLHHIFLINSSDLADAVIDLMVPYLNGENRAAIRVYGFNKEEWQKEILRLVDADQIRPEFGGTKVDTLEF